jgi:amino acid adenylation domain-containing protein
MTAVPEAPDRGAGAHPATPPQTAPLDPIIGDSAVTVGPGAPPARIGRANRGTPAEPPAEQASTSPESPAEQAQESGRSAAAAALLAKRLRKRATAPRAVIPPRPEGTAPPLSFAQERVWFMDQIAPGEAAYHIAVPLRVRGPLDEAVLRAALATLTERHEALRTRFPADADGRPLAVVEDRVDVPLHHASATDAIAAQTLVDAVVLEPFDLANGPLLRALLIRLSEEDHILLLTQHHIVGDGWSVDVLLRDLIAAYHGRPMPELPVQYGDFAHWEAARPADEHLAYWRERLAGIEPLELPTDHSRPATQTYRGDFVEFTVPTTTAERLRALAAGHSGTLFMVLLAAYQVLLSRHSGQDDFAVGVSSAGRSAPELEDVVGMFINMLPMRADLADDPTFAELLDRTKRGVLDAFEHADVPFAKVVQDLGVPRDVSRSPVFQSMFVLQNYEMGRFAEDTAADAVTFEWTPMELRATRFDFELHVVEVEAGLWGKLVYNTDLFDRATVELIAERWTALVEALAADPAIPVSRVDIRAAADRALPGKANATAAPFPDATLHALVEAQVERTPEAPAVTFGTTTLTYAQLNARANRIAHRLIAEGVGPETLVAVCANRCADLPAALLGVLKAGAAYLPLDPEYPADRLAFMVADAQAPVLLVTKDCADKASAGTVLVLEDDFAAGPTHNPPAVAAQGNAAYVIYTSGSTGRPKGVPNTHRGIVNRLDWMQRAYGIGEADTVLQKTPFGFDVSVWEFFWPLQTGARLVLAKPGGHKDAAYLRDLINDEGVTTAHFVPSMLGVFLSENADCPGLRRVICSGEELPAATAREFTSRFPGTELHNLYGPTEAAIDVTAWHCADLGSLSSVPIGAPIANLRVDILDRHGVETPIGVAGELHIGGVGVARGYHDRPALTAEKFVPDPHEPGARRYATGDLARWRRDGTVEFLGRLDHQVKLRGLRIELGEIESALRDLPGVADAAVIVRQDTPGDQRLTGYLVGEADHAAVKAELKRRLPEYMVPTALVDLDALPLTPNGKLDRKALPAPQITRSGELVAPRTDAERALAAIWTEVLTLPAVGIDDDFFDIGGHSLLATQVVAKIRKIPDARPVGVMDLFTHRTIRALAEFMAAEDTGQRGLLYELTKPGKPAELTYVCVPYGGGSAIVYQPLADALPDGHALFSVAIPGHDVGLDEAALPFDELTTRIADEVRERVTGPLALYGHCGVGSAITAEVARKLEEAGREIDAVYIGAMFPFARPKGPFAAARTKVEKLKSNRHYASWLKSMGVDTDEIDPEQADRIISNMRADSRAAEDYFTDLLDKRAEKLRAPVISVVGSQDPVTDYYAERYVEWQFLSDTLGLVVLDEAGHFFLKYRADELAEIVSRTHRAIAAEDTEELSKQPEEAPWDLRDWQKVGTRAPSTVTPSMGRFLAVALGQLIATTGAALTAFALPIWLYTRTGSVTDLGLLWALALLCGVVMLPIAGGVIDRVDRRRVMMVSSCASGVVQLVLAALLWTESIALWHIYVLVSLSQVAASFQRLAFQSSVPQLVPKRYLGHAMGIAQLSSGFALLLMPLLAAGLLAQIGLRGIVLIDVGGYLLAIITLLFVKFPDLLGWRPREPLGTAILNGLRYSWRHRGFRLMLGYFALGNVFLAPALVLLTPLVLAFGDIGDVAAIALAEAVGALVGGLAMAVWGGPRKRRMIGVLCFNLGTALGCMAIGVHPSVVAVGVGVFLLAMSMALAQGVYSTIVQVKVPQRFHGRVFAINQTLAWSTLPIGFALLAPLASSVFEPLLAPGGALADSVGAVIGTGEGRGIGFAYLVFGALLVLVTAGGWAIRTLRRFDTEVPDSLPDDLVGAQERANRLARHRSVTVSGLSSKDDAAGQGRDRESEVAVR